MSKSDDNVKNFILLLDELNVVVKKIKSVVIDLDGIIKFDCDNKLGIINLILIYVGLIDMLIKDIEVKYEGEGYGKFKGDFVEIVKVFLVEF